MGWEWEGSKCTRKGWWVSPVTEASKAVVMGSEEDMVLLVVVVVVEAEVVVVMVEGAEEVLVRTLQRRR